MSEAVEGTTSDNGYKKLFDPQPFEDHRSEDEKANPELGDRRDGKVYRYNDAIILAVNVALATGRPLLVRGPSGSGKSSLAYNVARVLGRKYYEFVITSRTQAQDLLWRYDAVRRLGDAQAQRIVVLPSEEAAGEEAPPEGAPPGDSAWRDFYRYIEPGVLWWMLDPVSAARRGYPGEAPPFERAQDPAVYTPGAPQGDPVLLLDEIDKADPDFANNLLVPIGSLQFHVDEIGLTVSGREALGDPIRDRPLIIITTNEERRLPRAFLRRCIALELEGPGRKGLVEIASKIYGNGDEEKALYRQVVEAMTALVRAQMSADPFADDPLRLAGGNGEEIHLSVAQFLDAVQACRQLRGVDGDAALFDEVIRMTGWKESRTAL